MIEKSEKPKRKAAINQLCRVCHDEAHGFHFEVMVCRACAAFFRRTVALSLQYKCRFNNSCEINSHGGHPSLRSTCRSCRFAKCVKLGMKSESVQINPPVSSSSASTTPTPTPKSEQSNSTASTPTMPPATINSNFCDNGGRTKSMDDIEADLFNRVNNIFENALRNSWNTVNVSVIDQFRIALNQLRINRQVKHTVKLVELGPYHGKEEFKTVWKENWEKIEKMSEDEIDMIAEMVCYIQPFILLPPEQRWVMFKQFWLSFARLERAYETFRVYGDDVNDTRTLFYNGQCMSIFGELIEEAGYLEKSEYKELIPIFRTIRTFMVKGLLVPIKKLKPTEIEFAVMCLQLLWQNPGVEAITDDTNSIASLCRQQAFNELHFYYTQQLGISNYAARLGEFMALMVTVEKYMIRRKENMIITDLFSPVKVNPALISATR